MNEKISIIMPTYNQNRYIKKAIESIINQYYIDWKLYIIDDGSTDNTEEIVKPYLSDRVEYFKKENGGTGHALNYALQYTKGPYQTYVSSDNIYHPIFLGSLTKILDTMPDILFAYSDFQFIDEHGRLGAIIKRPTYRTRTIFIIIYWFYQNKKI